MRCRVPLAWLLSVLAAVPAAAQSVKGVVIDDSSKLAIEGVLITLMDGSGREQPRSVRSDSSGAFIIHASRPGSYRVRAARIGYRPVTSEPVSFAIGQLAIVRLRMGTIAQQLIPVRIVERRRLNAAELMSTTGFDLRESKGLGHFVSSERLAAMGHDGVRDILGTQLQPTLFVRDDPVLGEVLRIRQGRNECAPEIFLDGRLLATAPDPMAIIDSSNVTTAMDSMRLRMTVESEKSRVAASQTYAMSVLANLRAVDLHGVEVYRANELPPPSLGGWFGTTRSSVRPCGTVAVWTKDGGGRPVLEGRTRRADALQVISGTTIDFDTNRPLRGVTITLLNDARDRVGHPVRSDEHGEFRIRTDRIGPVRLHVGSVGYNAATTAAFAIAADELVFVRVFVSGTQPVLAPFGIAARVQAQTFGVSSRGGFTYRRERATGGTFFTADDIRRRGARTVADLVRALPGVRTTGPAATDSITFLPADDLPRCRPAYYIDGAPVTSDVEARVSSLAMERVFGIEVYVRGSDAPLTFADIALDCGLIAIWMKP